MREDVIAPCSCRGSSKWVHRTCLDQWRTTREDKAFSKCTECLSEYTLITRIDDSYRPKLMRRANFFFFVLRDLSVAFLLLQMLIIGMSGIIYISDEKSHWLVSYFHSEAHIRLFYYSCGAVIFFSLVGLLYFTGFATTNGARCSPQICSNCTICNHRSSSGSYYGNSFNLPFNWCMWYDCGGMEINHRLFFSLRQFFKILCYLVSLPNLKLFTISTSYLTKKFAKSKGICLKYRNNASV